MSSGLSSLEFLFASTKIFAFVLLGVSMRFLWSVCICVLTCLRYSAGYFGTFYFTTVDTIFLVIANGNTEFVVAQDYPVFEAQTNASASLTGACNDQYMCEALPSLQASSSNDSSHILAEFQFLQVPASYNGNDSAREIVELTLTNYTQSSSSLRSSVAYNPISEDNSLATFSGLRLVSHDEYSGFQFALACDDADKSGLQENDQQTALMTLVDDCV